MAPSIKPELIQGMAKEMQIQRNIEEQQHIQHRIEELEKMLNTPQQPAQITNITAALEIYRQGKSPGGGMFHLSYFQDGVLKPLDEIDFRRPMWHEVRSRSVILLITTDFWNREWLYSYKAFTIDSVRLILRSHQLYQSYQVRTSQRGLTCSPKIARSNCPVILKTLPSPSEPKAHQPLPAEQANVGRIY